MLIFDKSEIRNNLTIENIFDLLQEWGGEPQYSDFGILCRTICHNQPGEGSKKLYYYNNSGLFRCYTECGNFDIFELVIKIANIQWKKVYDLNDAVRWIAQKFGMTGKFEEDPEEKALDDWKYLENYERIQDIEIKTNNVILKEYDNNILDKFNYKLKIKPWLKEGINQSSINRAKIGYYPGGDQITIPHFDVNGRLIGVRGRTLCEEEGLNYGKYRPLKINKELYNHPLGMNLYNLNNSKENIKLIKKAIIFESEDSL